MSFNRTNWSIQQNDFQILHEIGVTYTNSNREYEKMIHHDIGNIRFTPFEALVSPISFSLRIDSMPDSKDLGKDECRAFRYFTPSNYPKYPLYYFGFFVFVFVFKLQNTSQKILLQKSNLYRNRITQITLGLCVLKSCLFTFACLLPSLTVFENNQEAWLEGENVKTQWGQSANMRKSFHWCIVVIRLMVIF